MNTNKDALDAFEWLYRSYIQANNCSVANGAADAVHNALQTQAELVEALRKLESSMRQKKGFYSISVGHSEVKQAHKAGILKGLDAAHEEIKKALARAEGRE